VSGEPPVAPLGWNPCWRLVPSRFPPVGLFDDVARPDELEAVAAVQALTNPRLRQEAGEISLVSPAERVSGPGSTPVMAAFCHLNPEGSRFSDGSWGVYYAAESIATAVAEVAFHRARFLAATAQPAIEVDLRAYRAEVVEPLHDLRGPGWQALLDPDPAAYPASQALARRLRAAGSWGLAWRSVRRPGGECVALLRPRAVALPVVQGPHLALRWDGRRITGWYEKSGLATL
jgi:RES domain-containing protein